MYFTFIQISPAFSEPTTSITFCISEFPSFTPGGLNKQLVLFFNSLLGSFPWCRRCRPPRPVSCCSLIPVQRKQSKQAIFAFSVPLSLKVLCHTPQSQLFWQKRCCLLAVPGTEGIPYLWLCCLWDFWSTLCIFWWVEPVLHRVLKYLLVL